MRWRSSVQHNLDRRALTPRGQQGFTIIELVVITLIVGILAAVIGTKMFDMSSAEMATRRMEVASRIRHAQIRAMKQASVWGVRCDATDYWLFTGNDPDSAADRRAFPGAGADKVSLASKGMAMDAFTVYFDRYGIPYTSYTSAAVNTKVGTGSAVGFTLTVSGSGDSHDFSIEPETGFIQ